MFGRSSLLPPGLGLDSLEGARRRREDVPGIPRGLLGSSNPFTPPIRATPEARRREAQFGTPDTRQASGPSTGTAVAPQPQGLTLGDMLGQEPQRPDRFWQGGKKFTGRDALAGILAAVGDAFMQQSGGRGGYSAVSALTNQRQKGLDALDKALQQYAEDKRIAALPGMTLREYAAYQMDPKAWGGHMSDATSSHYAAANLNPGDQRVFGNPNAGGSVYQAPTAAEQYAGSLGEVPQTPGYRTALQDYTLRASGPTAYGFDTRLDDYRTDNDMSLENLRQRNRMSMEGVRQGNRTQLRGTPTYRDTHPPAPRGGRENIPTVQTPAEARALPPGTKYRTPDGKVKIR